VQLVDFLDQEQRAMDWQSLMHRARRNIAYSHMYFVPYTLDFIAANTRTRGDRTVRMTSKLAASIFNITPILYASQGKTMLIARRVGLARAREVVFAKARQMIRTQKLMSPHIVVSYAGDPDDVEHMPGYQRLLALARLSDVTVHLAVMGMVNAVNVGPYALSIGYIADADCSQSMHTIA
jgi:fatty acid-binding protein DegV